MKRISIIAICTMVVVSAVIVGCVKNVLNYGDIKKLDDTQALLKINYASQYANNRTVFFKINGQRVSYLVTGRTPFPGGGYNTGGANSADFMQVPAGDVKFAVGLPRKVDNGTDSLELYSTTVQLTGGKIYVLHVTDTAATTKSLLTEQNFTLPDSTIARFNFINLMPNVPAIDLYYGSAAVTATDQSTDSLLVGNVAYMQASREFTIRYNGLLNGVTTNKIFKIRPAGAPTNATSLLATYTSASVPANQRVFYAFASGYSGKVSPSTQRPYISFTLIR